MGDLCQSTNGPQMDAPTCKPLFLTTARPVSACVSWLQMLVGVQQYSTCLQHYSQQLQGSNPSLETLTEAFVIQIPDTLWTIAPYCKALNYN